MVVWPEMTGNGLMTSSGPDQLKWKFFSVKHIWFIYQSKYFSGGTKVSLGPGSGNQLRTSYWGRNTSICVSVWVWVWVWLCVCECLCLCVCVGVCRWCVCAFVCGSVSLCDIFSFLNFRGGGQGENERTLGGGGRPKRTWANKGGGGQKWKKMGERTFWMVPYCILAIHYCILRKIWILHRFL